MASRTLTDEEFAAMEKSSLLWKNGTRMTNVQEFAGSAVVSNGQAIFYLTDDGTANGNALFTEIFKETANFWTDSAIAQFQYGNYTLSGNKKTLTIDVNRIGINIGVLIFTAAANGTTVYMRIKGQ